MNNHPFKKLLSLFLLVSGFALLFVSCKKDKQIEITGPVIELTEVGSDDNKQAYIGGDVHLEGAIQAEGLIEKIEVEIHQKGGSFAITKSYTDGKYIGVRATEFHEHLDIPADAPAGNYHLHLRVTDKNGKTATAESALKLLQKPVHAALIFQEVTSTDPEFKHGDHFHGTGSASPVGHPVNVTFDESGQALSGGHLHLDPEAVYRITLKTYDAQGGENQASRFTEEANHKVFLTGATFKLNKDESDGAIFTADRTGTILHFTIGDKNEGLTKNVKLVWRKLNAGVTAARNDWNKADYVTLFPGSNDLELNFELHAEHGH